MKTMVIIPARGGSKRIQKKHSVHRRLTYNKKNVSNLRCISEVL
jgi:CMP-N-acetylneuraminic acid synthetase